jgi:hypothetical protein
VAQRYLITSRAKSRNMAAAPNRASSLVVIAPAVIGSRCQIRTESQETGPGRTGYRRADVGSVPVLGLLTARAYRTIRGGDPPANPIEREMARVLRARAAVYPRGWSR